MIHLVQGNLFKASADALVNTVNEVGVMGKGIALMFREQFPENTKAYEEACRRHQVRVGTMFVTRNKELVQPQWIVNFPTKKHWRQPSKYQWIADGLVDLKRVIRSNNIQSIAIPPLGCGAGGLEWTVVKKAIIAALSDLEGVDVYVYEPSADYQSTPKRNGVEMLTIARALIAELIREYSTIGIDCTNLEVQKLAWFLHRALKRENVEDVLQLQFSANRYGPYADQLRHLLNGLDGSFLHCGKRLSDAGPETPIHFEDSKKEMVKEYLKLPNSQQYLPALNQTLNLISGFESPLGMELLATVDWLLSEEKVSPTVEDIRNGLKSWPAGAKAANRKQRIFSDRLIEIAIARLNDWTNSSLQAIY